MATSGIIGDDWEHAGLAVRVSLADDATLERLDTWRARRTGQTGSWDWRRLSSQCRECFVASVADEPVVALAGPRASVTIVSGVPCYRLDYVEVAPERRRADGWGAFALVLAAHRGAELGARGLVMPALRERVGWLGRLGAQRVPKYAWRCDRELVALWIVGQSFDILVEP